MSWRVTGPDAALVRRGRAALELARSQMPVLEGIRREVADGRPLAGHRLVGCVHLTKETGVLVQLLVAAGAQVAWTGGDEVSTQDDVAAALSAEGVRVYGRRGMTTAEVDEAAAEAFDAFPDGPTMLLDNGARLIERAGRSLGRLPHLCGATEKTSEGSRRIRELGATTSFPFPVVSVNDVVTKWEVDNTYGTGQSTLDGILRATGTFLAGKRFVVCGYGHVGRGVAQRARGLGARVVVVCRSARTAVRARVAGFEVLPLEQAARLADIVCTATGRPDVLTAGHLDLLPSGAVLCNTGHSTTEINLADLAARTRSVTQPRPHVQRHLLHDGRYLDLLSGGGLVNLDAAEGNPSEVMDVTFANQALVTLDFARAPGRYPPGVQDVDPAQDEEVARRKLATMGVRCDEPDDEAPAAADATREEQSA
ncbi:adenosylhomocysteinase [Streptomyces sp. NBRC 110611]|uniref:adenosylhomocysteinase n=1 Tax=Streptomyces sp. NBRC 110611 TaxID=1621259 RepID=UPI00082F5383|nr:adenosylhomocysteinase [Streptomyces sp. NBRC 110611]GAU66490.1 adenosylhomocysteinase [Streptomyces sp. NBRC 110611]